MRALTTKRSGRPNEPAAGGVEAGENPVPIVVSIITILLLPSVAPLIGMLMLGNLFRESGRRERYQKTAQNELINIVTIFLGVTVGATAKAETFCSRRRWQLSAWACSLSSSAPSGRPAGKLMYLLTKGKVNPLIGSAGVFRRADGWPGYRRLRTKANPRNWLFDARHGALMWPASSARPSPPGFLLALFREIGDGLE